MAMIPYLPLEKAAELKTHVQGWKNERPGNLEFNWILSCETIKQEFQISLEVTHAIEFADRARDSEEADIEDLASYIEALKIDDDKRSDKIVKRIAKYNEGAKRSPYIAALENERAQEKVVIQDSLLEIISLDPIKVSTETQRAATMCLFNLFEDCTLLLAAHNGIDGAITRLQEDWREFPRLVILENAIRENVAMDVPGFYRFSDIWEKMVRHTINDEELCGKFDSEISCISLENIYANWASRKVAEYEVNYFHESRLIFINQVIHSYYALLAESKSDIGSVLLFSSPPFVLTEVRTFRHQHLGKLYFFKQFEAVTMCSQLRSGRMKDLILDESASGVRVRIVKFIKKESFEWVVRLEILDGDNESNLSLSKSLKEYILVDDNREASGVLEAIRFPDMKYRKEFFKYPLTVLCVQEFVDDNSCRRFVDVKGKFMKKVNADGKSTYRLYKRYVDFNLDKVLETLVEIDDREDGRSVFLDVLRDPNAWGSTLPSKMLSTKEIKKMTMALRDSFGMSIPQQNISTNLLNRRLQIVWGPPGSGKTQFLSLFLTWYLTSMRPKPTGNNKNFIVGITAFTRAAIDNLLERIAKVQKEKYKTSEFTLVRLVKNHNKNIMNNIDECRAESLPKKMLDSKIGIPGKPIVVGGTVWDWSKVRKEWKKNSTWSDILIIDEGSQLLVSDACIALESLNPISGRLIVAGDHMQLGPIIQNSYPVFPDDHPLIFGSIQQCLMRKEDGKVFREEDFFLRIGKKHDFGPSTIQLPDNWRMNKELTEFFQKIYGDDYRSRIPHLKLNFDDPKLMHINNLHIRRALNPNNAISMIKISLVGYELPADTWFPVSGMSSDKFLQTEADIVAQIVMEYFDSRRPPSEEEPSLFVVTPHHRQRHAIQSRLSEYISNPKFNLQINTVEKMQGQEADLVIACFGFIDPNEIARESGFLFDRSRWNVAVSRAKCKVIIITTDEMLYPRRMEVFTNKKT
ncbi:7680_t:CDS:10, partial [Acaulospora colombiana]